MRLGHLENVDVCPQIYNLGKIVTLETVDGPLTHVYYVSNEHFTGAFVRRDAGARAVKEPFFASQAVSSLSLVRIHLGCSSSLPVLTLAWFP